MTEIAGGVERHLILRGRSSRADLGAFLTRALRLDESAVIRFRNRGEGHVTAWVNTGLDVLAARTIEGQATPTDLITAADHLLQTLRQTRSGIIHAGYSMDSAWRGALPPDGGYSHVDDVPAHVLIDLAQRGADLAREHNTSQGTPGSLLDQEVLTVRGEGGTAAVTMRAVFAMTGMGFIPKADDPTTGAAGTVDPNEIVRVRARSTWVRIDARFGSVAINRSKIPLFVR
ncbi:hypothetical protein [Hoyosella altamirensis]|uniref:Uncharacterized protein n=1 Tax=Hoyosella altamirensis TaxID=616997 RepID=A0A839RT96_9ACTN|nr:hypothetical protein [Hoyosella altamirensis]MBB3039123.1 hypothetical protein [Hoyosella altamirensis]